MTKLPIRLSIFAIFALVLLLGTVEATSPVKTIGTWAVDKPLGKNTLRIPCGIVVAPYLTLFWSFDKLMLVRESANQQNSIAWKVDIPLEVQGAVFAISYLYNCDRASASKIDVFAARGSNYWKLICDSYYCSIASGPKPIPTKHKIEEIHPAIFPILDRGYYELTFISLGSAHQIQTKTGLVTSEYHWNTTTFGFDFEPVSFLSISVSTSGRTSRYDDQLTVAMRCKQYEPPFSSATCVVSMGMRRHELDSTTFFSPTTANFHFNNFTSKVSWTDNTPGHGLIAIHQRGKPEAAPLDLPFIRDEVWAGPNWRDDQHESGILASYVPGSHTFQLWYIVTLWNQKVPEVVLVRSAQVTGTEIPILPHPRGYPGAFQVPPSILALAYDPISRVYQVNFYTVPVRLSTSLVCPMIPPGFYAQNCRDSSCEIESRGDCPSHSMCFGTSRGVFQCCHGPPL